MSARTIPLALLALAMAGTACQPPAQEAAGLSEEDVAAIEASLESFAQAIRASDWAALTALYTEDAVFMAPNQPALEGRAAMRAWLELFPPIAQYEATSVEIDGRGDLAHVRGNYSETYTVEGAPEPIHDTGKYVEIWRKQPDGSWLIAVEIWNSDLPLPEEGGESET
jgi:ketosteroid isomerase-like protein